MSCKLYTYPGNSAAYKALIAAKYTNVAIDVPAFQMGVDNKTPEFLKKNPNGKVPTLETAEGCIFESNAIARYVARQGEGLYGKNAVEAAQIDAWCDWALASLTPAIGQWIYPYFGYLTFNQESENEAKEKTKALLQLLNNFLADKTFLVGERLSLADIVISMTLLNGYKIAFEPSFRAAFVNVNRYFNTLINQPNFKVVIGDVTLAAKAPELPKKEEKKPQKEETEVEEEKPKAKNPLDLLPPSKMNFDEFKRTYSNSDTRSVAIPWFFENFDPEGYTCYFADYKYNDELEAVFKTCNLVGGFYQRLDRLHKYAFGSTLILGADGKQAISGFWIFRGPGIPAILQEVDDFTLYNWKKVETFDDATKALIGDYMAWDKPVNGMEVLDGKIFK